MVAGGQVKRAGPGRWSKAKEKIFFDELAATANARMAAAAVGLTKNAVLQRKRRHPAFAAKWDAVVAAGRANIDLYLVEATDQTFDPDELHVGEGPPKVTIDQAIKISQIAPRAGNGGMTRKQWEQGSFEDEAEDMGYDAIEEVRERIMRKLAKMRQRDDREKLAAGWTWDESWGLMIPPGYVQGPDYKPKEPEPPRDPDAGY